MVFNITLLNLKILVMKTFYIFLLVMMGVISANAGELFVRVNANGKYIAKIYNQSQENINNTFRFFDVPNGKTNLVVQNTMNGKVLYNGYVQVGINERVVTEINNYGILSIVQRIQINVINWYTSNSGTYGNGGYGNNGYGNIGHGNYGNGGVNNQNFNQFLMLMDGEAMDSNRLTMAKNYADAQGLRVEQIRQIMLKLTFDSNRLDFAKTAYANCLDRANYVLLKDAFTMTSNYNALMKYIGGY